MHPQTGTIIYKLRYFSLERFVHYERDFIVSTSKNELMLILNSFCASRSI